MAIDPVSTRALAALFDKPEIGASKPLAPKVETAAPSAAGSFTDSLKQLIDTVDQTDATANNAVNDMVTGTGDVHHAMIALQKADMMLELTVQVRNKLVNAYQDIMRMPM